MSAVSSPGPSKAGRGAFVFAVIAIGLLFIALLGLLYYGVRRSGDADRDVLPSTLIGKPAPAFDLPLLHGDGRRLTLSRLRGKPFLLNVWGSWCPECQVEHPAISRFARTKRVRLIGYNLKDELADAEAWLEQFGDPYSEVIVDADGRAALDWGIYGTPETFLIDAKGRVRWKHVGPMNDQIIRQQLVPLLDRLDAGQ